MNSETQAMLGYSIFLKTDLDLFFTSTEKAETRAWILIKYTICDPESVFAEEWHSEVSFTYGIYHPAIFHEN